KMACRSEPSPLSLVLITRRVAHHTGVVPAAPIKIAMACATRIKALSRSADLRVCCIADFPVGGAAAAAGASFWIERPAGLETCDTADSEVCATLSTCGHARPALWNENVVFMR